jgi:hypothetical protein
MFVQKDSGELGKTSLRCPYGTLVDFHMYYWRANFFMNDPSINIQE